VKELLYTQQAAQQDVLRELPQAATGIQMEGKQVGHVIIAVVLSVTIAVAVYVLNKVHAVDIV